MTRVLYMCLSVASVCATNTTCSVEIGTASMTFEESTEIGLWKIQGIICDSTVAKSSPDVPLNSNDYIPGACSQLGDRDFDTYYQFMIGLLCYPAYADRLKAKADKVMLSSYEHFAGFAR